MRAALVPALALMVMTASPAMARELSGAPVTVTAPAGTIEGRTQGGVDGFADIPYAAPPVGPLRWRPPGPAPRWQGARQAVRFGNDCPQLRIPGDATPSDQPMSEDCLVLNVWRPAGAHGPSARSRGEERAPRAPLPVMVWIHGGAFVAGSSASPVLDGAALARRGVVLISFNYRLGRFGFFAHPALTREAGGHPDANFAFLDMIAALRWVRDNAAAFGGDPGNVTIFGESAGGAAVAFLMAAPPARGLFHKAILQSGAGRQPYARLDTDRPSRISAHMAGFGFAAGAGLSEPDPAALRALPTEKVLGGLAFYDLQPLSFTGPVIDGRTVLADPDDQFAAGRVPAVPFMIGSTGAELSEEPFAGIMLDLIRAQQGAAGMAILQRAYGDPPARALIDDYFFTEGARGFARMMARRAPTWLYVFDHVAEVDRGRRHGANHASELAYLFGNLPANAGPDDRETARLMGDYWVNFARTGDPNGASLPGWPRLGRGDPLLLFGANAASVERNRNAARLDAVERAMAARPR
jgi:para-nitrobenzyl esterase